MMTLRVPSSIFSTWDMRKQYEPWTPCSGYEINSNRTTPLLEAIQGRCDHLSQIPKLRDDVSHRGEPSEEKRSWVKEKI
jgi:hypothetical protein